MARDNRNTPGGLVIKRHNIRIWCHDCDMARLQRVVWDGHGSRLLSEVSNQPIVKRFLEAVPYIMNTIRDMHSSVIQNDLESLMKHCGDPVPPQALSSRDPNNLTVLHKAAGLGHGGILKYIANRYPQGINDIDNDGRTPLHYAAAVRDDQHTYNTLITLGADESAVDNKNKTPVYYTNRPQEIDKNIFKTLPEAPRTPSSAYPPTWDWKLLDTEAIVELNKKSRRRNLKASNENISSKDTNTNTISESTDNRTRGMKGSSTHELINDLPELDDNQNRNEGEINKDSEVEVKDEIKEQEENAEISVQEDEHSDNQILELHDRDDVHTVDDVIKIAPDIEDSHGDKSNHDNEVAYENEEAPKNEEIHCDKDTHGNQDAHDSEDVCDIKDIQHSEHVRDIEDIKHNEDSHDKDDNEETPLKLGNNTEKKSNESIATAYEKSTEHFGDDTDNVDKKSETIEEIPTKISTEENTVNTIDDSNENGNADQVVQNIGNQEGDNNTQETSRELGDDENQCDTIKKHDDNINEFREELQDDRETDEQDKNNFTEKIHVTKDTENNEYDNYTVSTNGQHAADSDVTTSKGNSNDDQNEDDDDVQVQGETHSEYSDLHLRSTADLSDMGSAKRGNATSGRSTQESLIEGIISGEAEQDSLDASIMQRDGAVHGEILVIDNEIDPEVTQLINNANMEMLATLVLNGEGSRLIGRRSRNSELQAFIDNVPTYMQKINKVHAAAREGNIRDLQSALDRRKFAIARDPISPNGATPLHVATVFGKTNIIKYLGGRFPETLSAVDFEGRTALHYAAVLPDNGHYYNLLKQLGANSKDLDDNGNSAEEYLRNPSLLPFDHLVSEYGISEDTAKSMFADKGPSQVDNDHADIPMFNTDEGRYLAKSLGDPLIKGLTEVANVKPKDPVAFLASFLSKFPEKQKPAIGTQEPNLELAEEAEEIQSEQAPPSPIVPPVQSKEDRSGTRTATRSQRPIDVVTVDPLPATSPDAPEIAFSSASRDEHGQSMLHFAAARTHARNALFQLLQESDISLGYRDELYRTARDVSIQANVPENTSEIDKWVLHLAARGNADKIMELLMEGYDHILDIVDEEGVSITEVIAKRSDSEMSNLLASIPTFEESRELLHVAVRTGNLTAVQAALLGEGSPTLARSRNSYGRTALHIAVLMQHEDVVTYLAQNYPDLLRVGDNLERTPLHYAMGVDKMESLSRILIKTGAKRVLKDLKGRQPTYYFMNKSDILRLKEEEDAYL